MAATIVPRYDRIARGFAIGGVIAAAVALALLWVYLIPMLEASDESDHFDYVLSVAHVGHLIPARTLAPYPTYDAETFFLETYTAFPRIDLNLHDRVPTDYGNHDFYERIDRRARLQLSDRWTSGPNAHSPVLLPFYPFGYYALAATWMRAFGGSGDSIVRMFFAARLLSVALLAITLTCIFGIARLLGVRPLAALVLTAVIGTFTLTTFVASYVQPDNLTWTCCALASYLALRLRARASYRIAVPLAIVLGVLAITKYQYWLTMAGTIAPLVVMVLVRRSTSTLKRLTLPPILLMPTAITLALQLTLIGTNPSFTVSETSHLPKLASAGDVWSYAFTFTALLWAAFYHFFIAGFQYELDADPHFSGATSYWGNTGWLDTPLSFGHPAIDVAVHFTIQIFNVAIIVLTGWWLARTTFRLARLALRRSAGTAARLASANVPLNSYLFFIAFMIFFYALTNNMWRVSGRNWLPFVEPAFLLGFWYAPRALPRLRWRRIAGATVLAALIAYSSVGSFFAAASAEERYYGRDYVPPLASMHRGPPSDIVVDQIYTAADPSRVPVDAKGTVFAGVRQGQQIEITGWAADITQRSAAGGVVAVMDGKDEIAASYGFATEYVSKNLGNPLFFWAGYHFFIPTDNFTYGEHEISLFVISKDLKTYFPTTRQIRIVIDPPRPIVIGDHRHIVGSLDQAVSVRRGVTIGPETDEVWLERTDTLLLRGWADEVIHHRAVEKIEIRVDGHKRFLAKLGDLRPELIATFPNSPPSVAMYSGYTALVPMRDLADGIHHLSMTAYDSVTHEPVTLLADFTFGCYSAGSYAGFLKSPYVARPLPFSHADLRGYIDVVAPLEQFDDSAQTGAVWVDRQNLLFIRGWGLDKTHRRTAGKLTVVIDGTLRQPMHMGAFRGDLAAQFPTLPATLSTYAGFNAAISMAKLVPGAHRFSIVIGNGKGGETPLVRDFRFAVF